MNNKNIWLIVGALIAVGIAGMVLLKKPGVSPSPAVTSTPENVVSEVVEEDTEPVQEIQVSGKEFSFNPSSISVKKGDKVRIIFQNEGKMPHDFVIEELDIRTKVLKPGESETLSFTVPDDASSLTYYCSVGTHRTLGMEGNFKIE